MLDTWINYDQVKWNYVSEHLKTFWTLGRDQSRSKAYPTNLWELFYRLRAKKSKEEEGSKEKKRASKGVDFWWIQVKDSCVFLKILSLGGKYVLY